MDKVLDLTTPETQKVFSEQIWKLNWYPYETFASFLRATDKTLGEGDTLFCRRIGAMSSERDLRSVLNVYKKFGDPKLLITACTVIWQKYYRNAGSIDAISYDPDNTVLQITDFPKMDPCHCRLMEGWMSHSMELIGMQMITMTEIKCMSVGDLIHEFVCKWRHVRE